MKDSLATFVTQSLTEDGKQQLQCGISFSMEDVNLINIKIKSYTSLSNKYLP